MLWRFFFCFGDIPEKHKGHDPNRNQAPNHQLSPAGFLFTRFGRMCFFATLCHERKNKLPEIQGVVRLFFEIWSNYQIFCSVSPRIESFADFTPFLPAITMFTKSGQGAYFGFPKPSCRTSRMARQTSKPMKSAN